MVDSLTIFLIILTADLRQCAHTEKSHTSFFFSSIVIHKCENLGRRLKLYQSNKKKKKLLNQEESNKK